MTRSAPEISVIGAGVAGLCVATELVGRGAKVRIFDLNGAPGEHGCSWWAGGMLAPGCESETAEEPVVRLGGEAADWWSAQGVDVTRNGSIVLAMARDKKELNLFARRTKGWRVVDGYEIGELEPDLAGRHGTGLIFEKEAHLTPRLALAHLVEALAARGVEIEIGAGPRVGPRIDCRGLTARDELTDLRGVKGEMLMLRCPDVTLSRAVRLLHPRIPLYIVPRGEGLYMLGATMIEATERGRITARSMLEMLSSAYALHPAFAEAEVTEIGVDARPAFPDNMPRIRRRDETIFVNGLFRHGFLLAPSMARMVADLILDDVKPEVMDEDRR